MTIPIYLSSPPYRACEEDQQKCSECDRPAVKRGACAACYERHRAHKQLHRLALTRRYTHTADACTICDEVTALHAYGWDTRTILGALQRSAESVLRHLRQYGHPHADLFIPLATELRQQRKARP